MDHVRRIKDASIVLNEPPSPSTTVQSGATGSGRSGLDYSSQGEAGPSGTNGGSTPWYRVSRRDYPRSRHGYNFHSIRMQREGSPRLAEYITFWSFVSPDDLEEACGVWDEMEGVFAIASIGRVIVARISDEKGYEEIWTYQTQDEDHYHVAWSYDPISLRPILASGGKTGIVWLFDHWQGGLIRRFKGHGHEIYALVFHPLEPHILASASNDRTIRIWNIYGTEVELEDGDDDPLSENYPQGDADEGSYAIAILAGYKSGHLAGVGALAFHPHHAAIASGGLDHQCKIWPLPPIPPPNPHMPPTRRGHRPQLIERPLFSSDRIHTHPVDSVEWLNKDVLLSRAGAEMCAWKWLGYKSYFHPTEFEPFNRIAARADRISSHSFSIVLDIVEDEEPDWYWRMGVHLAFNPTEDEIDFSTVDLVRDTLFAYPIEARTAKPAKGELRAITARPRSIHLVNPFTWELGPQPKPPDDEYQRALTPDYNGDIWEPSIPIEIDSSEDDNEQEEVEDEDEDDDEDEEGETDTNQVDPDDQDYMLVPSRKRSFDQIDQMESPTISSRLKVPSTMTKVSPHKRYSQARTDTISALPTPPTSASFPTPLASTPTDLATPDAGGDKIKDGPYSQDPWALVVPMKDFEKCVNATKMSISHKRSVRKEKKLLACVAISPRGAKWIVTVGQAETIVIWRLKDKPETTGE